MIETLDVRWKPGTLDTLLVTASGRTTEWAMRAFKAEFGLPALHALYLAGRVTVTRQLRVAAPDQAA